MDLEDFQKIMINNRLSLSVAESCTGGSLCARLTQMSGCSNYFVGGVVAYSNELKQRILGVDPEMLVREGAVSEPVVKQMAEGLRKITNSDYCIAVSGIAGPQGGSLQKPIGTVYGAIASKEATHIWRLQLSGNRREIIEETCEIMLAKLIEKIYERKLSNGK